MAIKVTVGGKIGEGDAVGDVAPDQPGGETDAGSDDGASPDGLTALSESGLIDALSAAAGGGDDQKPATEDDEKRQADDAAKAAAAKAAPAAPEWDDLSDDRPWTESRIKAVAKQLQQDGATLGRKASELKSREDRLRSERSEHKKREDTFAATEKARMTDYDLLRTATGRSVLDALGRVTGRDPDALYEEMSLGIVGKRKDAPTAREKALEEKLDRIMGTLTEQQKANEQRASIDAEKHKRIEHAQYVRSEIGSVLGDAEQWPELARSVKENGAERSAKEFEDVYVAMSAKAFGTDENGYPRNWLDVERVANRIESTLRKNRANGSGSSTPKPSPEATNRATGSGPDRESGSPGASETRDSGARRISHGSLNPNLAAEGASRRDSTEEERAGDLARNFPDSLYQQLGFG